MRFAVLEQAMHFVSTDCATVHSKTCYVPVEVAVVVVAPRVAECDAGLPRRFRSASGSSEIEV
eukprot:SAG31_NODE_38431_length_296_cov_0.786802_1_plen_62_part_01